MTSLTRVNSFLSGNKTTISKTSKTVQPAIPAIQNTAAVNRKNSNKDMPLKAITVGSLILSAGIAVITALKSRKLDKSISSLKKNDVEVVSQINNYNFLKGAKEKLVAEIKVLEEKFNRLVQKKTWLTDIKNRLSEAIDTNLSDLSWKKGRLNAAKSRGEKLIKQEAGMKKALAGNELKKLKYYAKRLFPEFNEAEILNKKLVSLKGREAFEYKGISFRRSCSCFLELENSSLAKIKVDGKTPTSRMIVPGKIIELPDGVKFIYQAKPGSQHVLAFNDYLEQKADTYKKLADSLFENKEAKKAQKCLYKTMHYLKIQAENADTAKKLVDIPENRFCYFNELKENCLDKLHSIKYDSRSVQLR